MRVLIAAALLAACAMATAAELPRDIAGFTLGAPASLPRCANDLLEIHEGATEKRTCWAYAETAPASGDDHQVVRGPLEVRLAQDRIPPGFTGDVTLHLDDGRIAMVLLYTRGWSVDRAVIEQLVAKFGAPMHREVRPVTLRDGTSTVSTEMLWGAADDDVQASYSSTVQRGMGSVILDNAAGRAIATERVARRPKPTL